MNYSLNHRSGLPTCGLTFKHNWKEQISSYEVTESEVAYSDFGAIRAQIEFEEQFDLDLYEEVSRLDRRCNALDRGG